MCSHLHIALSFSRSERKRKHGKLFAATITARFVFPTAHLSLRLWPGSSIIMTIGQIAPALPLAVDHTLRAGDACFRVAFICNPQPSSSSGPYISADKVHHQTLLNPAASADNSCSLFCFIQNHCAVVQFGSKLPDTARRQ